MAAVTPNEPPATELQSKQILDSATVLGGTVHIYVAFDWGDEVNLDHARALVPAEFHDLPRRRRTPPSIVYRPPPLRFHLTPIVLDLLELGPVQAATEVTVFDFAAVSISLRVPFRLAPAGLTRL